MKALLIVTALSVILTVSSEFYERINNKYCTSGGLYGNYKSLIDAQSSCALDKNCAYVYDHSCTNIEPFELCSKHSAILSSSGGSCVYQKRSGIQDIQGCCRTNGVGADCMGACECTESESLGPVNYPRPPTFGSCERYRSEIFRCQNSACSQPINGCWSSWARWSDCSASCGEGGTRYRQRRCDSPVPSNGGSDCRGDNKQSGRCSRQKPCGDAARICCEGYGSQISADCLGFCECSEEPNIEKDCFTDEFGETKCFEASLSIHRPSLGRCGAFANIISECSDHCSVLLLNTTSDYF